MKQVQERLTLAAPTPEVSEKPSPWKGSSNLGTIKVDSPSDPTEKPSVVIESFGNADSFAQLTCSAKFLKPSRPLSFTSPPSFPPPPAKSQSRLLTLLERTSDKVYLLHYRFEVTFGLYVMEPLERVAFYTLFLGFILAVLMLLYYLPTWTIRACHRLAWYLTGDAYGATASMLNQESKKS
ncbi:hypothetical protein P152DRAFT_471675 [Eremomyces bilateralis CBS 781.70]|uniref:Uncharacterized protein n=1 Tax=Eremomyces bilateralis CBS 781.70 TaxID=1392243 RepID=A0A6G1GAB4_9PEZI|nr:uncharacterized protein P152DRAFT_471675 [Eremomyces bilateralis CBS 781.70]KAF1815027.1 hypothetical protein P152DRAFT_471675 [Eremomyces bilateralis CBS 781.70]